MFLGKDNLLRYNIKTHSPEWHRFRGNGIGGSELGAILNIDKWKSAVRVWHEKVGTATPMVIDNEAMFHGRLLEDYIANIWRYYDGKNTSDLQDCGYMKNYNEGKKQRDWFKVEGYVINKKYPYLFSSVDRLMMKRSFELMNYSIMENFGILEIKTIRSQYAKYWEAGIPPQYIAQVHQYMTVYEVPYAEIAMLSDGRNLIVYPIEFNKEFSDNMLNITSSFWESVKKGKKAYKDLEQAMANRNTKLTEEIQAYIHSIEPPVDSSEDYKKFISERYKRIIEKAQGDKKVYNMAYQHKRLGWMIQYLQDKRDYIGNALVRVISGHKTEKVFFEGDEKNYIKIHYKGGSDKLTLDNYLKIDKNEYNRFLDDGLIKAIAKWIK